MNPTSFRVGLVGAGYISEFHLRALRRLTNVTIVGITDLDISRARTVTERFGAGRAFASLKEMVSEGVEVVHVLTPPATHADIAMEAMKLGCHVLVEKPLAMSVEECDRIATAVAASGKQVCVDHSMLYDYFISRAIKMVRQGAIGDVLSADYLTGSAYPPYTGGPLPPQYREGGYPFRDVGTHALYIIEAFLGEIQNVTAQFASRGGDPNLMYDEWRAMVRCAHGSGQFQLSWSAKPIQNLLIVQGTRGVLRADLSSMTLIYKKSTPLPKAIERPIQGMSEGAKILIQVPSNAIRFVRKKILQYHGLQMLVEDFYRALASGQQVPVSVERARSIVKWLQPAAEEADRSKRNFVEKLPKSLTAPILVTGASGFIGGRLVHRLLREGARVRILVRREPPSEWMNNPNVEVVLGDLGDSEVVDRAVAGTKTVYHVGGAMKGGAPEHERGSVLGTRNVVESARRHKVQKLIFISSLSVIWTAAPRGKKKITESWPLEPTPHRRGVYSQAKQEAEKIVLDAVKESGLRAVILRPAKVIGPGVPPTSLETALRAGRRMVILGSGSLVPALVYVEDLVDSIQLAARSTAFDGSVFHIVDPTALTRNEFAKEYIHEILPGGKITHVPLAVMYCMAIGIELLMKMLGRPAPLSRYKLRSALAPFAYDCTAAEQRLGWRPSVGIRAGLAEILKSSKKN